MGRGNRMRIGVGLASVLDPDHRRQDRPEATVVVQIERLIDAEAALLGDAAGIRLGIVLVRRRPHLHQLADGVEMPAVVMGDQQHRRRPHSYLEWSDKLVEGSPKNSLSVVVMSPWDHRS
jgi:hypothetical protein